jgi:hypothetical protein
MKRTAALLRITVLGLVLGLVVAGGLAVYYYTLPPNSSGSVSASTRSSSSSSSPSDIKLLTNQPQGQQYITVNYNGTSYTVPAKGPNSPTFPCPTGTAPGLCTLLQETCGNGVGNIQEPWKTCYNCAFDAGCSGDNSCDPYTHECSSPATACMVVEGYGGP